MEDMRVRYGESMDNAWTLGQGYLLLAQAMRLLYKQYRNTAETSYQVLL